MAGKVPSLKLKAVVCDECSDDGDDIKQAGNDFGLPLERLSLGPRKKLLVLDLCGLLAHRVHYLFGHKTNILKYHRPDSIAGDFLVFKRPFCSEFLEFCFERFEVGIWSSARKWNIDNVLSIIMRGKKDKLLFVWGQNECTNSGFKSLERKEKPIFLKEMRKLWENTTLPWHCGQYTTSNTLLIDDEPYKALLNPPNTAIFPNSYKVDNGSDTVLDPKGDLRIFLDGLADADDVPSYVEENPFGQPAITELHSDWDYYEKIIREADKKKQ